MSEFQDTGMPVGTEDVAPNSTSRRLIGKWHNMNAEAANAKPTKDANIATPFMQYDIMRPKWDIINTVVAGTPAMRKAGEVYLPKHEYETDKSYNNRLRKATLKNYTLRTLENLTSKAFREDPKPVDDMPEKIKALWSDIDNEGNSLSVFARRLFSLGIQKGFSFIFVDFSDTTSSDTPMGRTLQQDIAENVRPFWRLIDPEDVIYMSEEKIDGRVMVTEVRIRGLRIEKGKYVDRYVKQITVYKPGEYETFEEEAVTTNSKKKTWKSKVKGEMSLNYIPIVPFYTSKKEGLCENKPPLEDLAYLNVEHFQSASDQRNALTVARFPILAASGASNDQSDNLILGPNRWLTVGDSQARIYYVEHQGHALAAGRSDLEDIEDQMASYGAEFLRKRPGASSATGRALDSMEAISPLMAWGIDFKDALELAIYYTADWMGEKDIKNEHLQVLYKIDPDLSIGEGKELELLDKARARKDLSRKSYLNELKRRDILTPEFDETKDRGFIDEEITNEMDLAAKVKIMDSNTDPAKTNLKDAGLSNNDRTASAVTSKRGPDRTTGEPSVTTA